MTERERREDGPEELVGPDSSVEAEQETWTAPVGEAGDKTIGAVSDTAGEAVRDAFAEGRNEATPWIALSGVMLIVGAGAALVIVLALVLYFLLGGD